MTGERPAVFDVVVAGGGSAGVTAAIASARTGARTLLIDRYGFLGGISTAVLDTFYGFFTPGPESRRVVGGIPDEIVDRLIALDRAILRPRVWSVGGGITYDPEALKLVWEDVALASGVELLYHAFVVGAVREEGSGTVRAVQVATKAGVLEIAARCVVDATGDADVVAHAGAPYAHAGHDGPAQTLTTTYRLSGVDTARARSLSRDELRAQMRAAHERGDYRLPHHGGDVHRTVDPGGAHGAMSRIDGLDPTDPWELTRAEVASRREALEYLRFLRNEVPGYERAQLAAWATQIGIRETRRILGAYTLTIDDVMGARTFSDGVARCGAPYEYQAGDRVEIRQIPDGGVYDIPFRALVPQLDNVLVAGRCISATHEAQASCRGMAQCMATGQAAGTAAAIGADRGIDVATIPAEDLRDRLRAAGAILTEADEQPLAEWAATRLPVKPNYDLS